MDPVQELCYLGIDTWVIGLSTATTPADHPYKVPRVTTGTYQGSSAVSLRNPDCEDTKKQKSDPPSTAVPVYHGKNSPGGEGGSCFFTLYLLASPSITLEYDVPK